MNITETMKQALEALTNPAMGYEEHFSAITSLRAAIAAAEKQEQVAYTTGTYGGHFTHRPANLAAVLPVGMALFSSPTQSDSAQAKIGCIGHDGECCKDREQVYLDAARYRKERDELVAALELHLPYADQNNPKGRRSAINSIYAAMKVGSGGVCHCAPLEK